jgi:hypothetical protein
MKFLPLLLALLPSISVAATPAKSAPSENKILWAQWYTITNDHKPFMYLHEEVELRPKEKQIAISQRYWEKTQTGQVKEYYIGSVANDDKSLSPVAFFVERNNPQGKVDGRAKKGVLQVKASSPGSPPQKLTVTMEKNTIFSNFLPLLLARQKKGNTGESIFYSVILEDSYGGVYQLDSGTAIYTKDSKKIGDSLCAKVENTFQGIATTWWISDQGKICRISVPSFGRTQEAVSEKEALNFLGK